ncbi:PHP domain-containing protein [Arcanobacterium pinnipediorum]|uniref:PHP domain-containing protein n=1 Tax=Arcanobacterium pinnipediorum TaxID=1503041 RepID=A0ABY5AG60_9ACTO|nr:PHP domain-containing protein [Arcanobacterium pinnipediorum]USR78966.1 PHP domain-containing protein [Arcanobacterium pinnipediorum]
MNIDLHTHSSYSDGTDSPQALIQRARHERIDVIGLTDHDTVAGWSEASQASAHAGIKLVRGMEITARYREVPVHILGYLFDPQHPSITAHIAKLHDSRIGRAREIIQRLAVDYPITFDDVVAHGAPGAVLGRPHIADALVSLGAVESRSQAFEELLAPSSPYYVSHYSSEAIDVVTFIRQAGGKSVWAHPWAASRGQIAAESAFEELADAGLFGVEVDHRDNPADTRPALADIVKSYGLARFGSSDYHGTGKPNQLGEFTTSADVYFSLIDGTFAEVI